jgi:hypothetical protein
MRKPLRSVLAAIAATALAFAGASTALASSTPRSAPAASRTLVGYICDDGNGLCLKAGTPVTVNGATNWYQAPLGDGLYNYEQEGTSNCLTYNATHSYVDMAPCQNAVSQQWDLVGSNELYYIYNQYNGECLLDANPTAALGGRCPKWYF